MIGSTARSGPTGSATLSTPAPPAAEPTPLAAPASATPAASSRGHDRTPRSPTDRGPYGRMFRTAPLAAPPADELRELAGRLDAADLADEHTELAQLDDNAAIPAGYTYLARFVNHDITFDPASSPQRQHDPDATETFRTPRLHLDGLYGRGPAHQPYLYDDEDPAKFRLVGADVARMGSVALIGDARNDEHLVLSQLHAALLCFHNAVVDVVREEAETAEHHVFEEAQRRVRWHYQWVVLNDLLPRLCGEDVLHDLLHRDEFVVTTGWSPDPTPPNPGHPRSSTTEVIRPRLRFYRYDRSPFIPVEYAAVAAAVSHAMPRRSYVVNDTLRAPAGTRPRLDDHRPLPADWEVDWSWFFRVSGAPHRPQASRRIAVRAGLPPAALTHLEHGARVGLPSGQAVARAMSLDPLPASRLALDTLPGLERETPLWYYALREAGELCRGCCLGPVGGRIVAETLAGLVACDPLSYLRTEPGWVPTLPFAGDTFRMADLVDVAALARR